MLSIVIIWNFIFQSLTNVQLQASAKLLISPWCEHRTMSSHPREPESPQSSLNSMSTLSNQCIAMSEWVDKARQWSAWVPIKMSYICEACGDCGLRGKYLRKCPFLGRAAAQVSWLRPKIMTISLPRMYFSATLRFNDVRVFWNNSWYKLGYNFIMTIKPNCIFVLRTLGGEVVWAMPKSSIILFCDSVPVIMQRFLIYHIVYHILRIQTQ